MDAQRDVPVIDELNPEEMSMYVMLNKHKKLIDSHTIELKLHAEQIRQLENGQMRMENLVMSENRETRNTIVNTNQQLHELIQNLMGYKTGTRQTDANLSIARFEQIAKILGILTGSGGILYYIFGQ